jgi:hypothetical protein
MVEPSNDARHDMRRKCAELGADRVFDKSHEIDALIACCSRLAAEPGPHGSTHGAEVPDKL